MRASISSKTFLKLQKQKIIDVQADKVNYRAEVKYS